MNDNIRKINIWHEEAMDLAEMAFFAARRNDHYHYVRYIQRALNYEKAAAKLLSNSEIEPSRSVLYQGAVHFALNLDYFDEVKKLIAQALQGNPPIEIKEDLEKQYSELEVRERLRESVTSVAQGLLKAKEGLEPHDVARAISIAVKSINEYENEEIDVMLNRIGLQITLESKNLVSNPDHQIFENYEPETLWVENRKNQIKWTFWEAYKKFLDGKGMAATTVNKLDNLTNDILNRIGNPLSSGMWDKRGMVVGDVQSGKTSNYIGLINKAADAGFRIIIILTGLYENLRQQTQYRIDEGFLGFNSIPENSKIIGVGKYRNSMPVHPITHVGNDGDLLTKSLRNHPLRTNDYYAIVIKKNVTVLKNLLNWLHAQGVADGEYHIIKDIPLLIIDDEADNASINIDKKFVSKINAYIRSILGLFEQCSFIGYTATPFANIFISDINKTEEKNWVIDGKKFKLGKDLFPKDFIVNIPPPSNYLGYKKVFNVISDEDTNEDKLPMISIVDDFEPFIPKKHLEQDTLPKELPPTLKYSIQCFIIICAIRMARGQEKEHNSMLVHISWYVNWINHVAGMIDKFLQPLKDSIRYNPGGENGQALKEIWEKEFKGRTNLIADKLGYRDALLIEHEWDEISSFLTEAAEKIEVRAVHGPRKNVSYEDTRALNYSEYENGLSVIAVGGNKLSRGLTLEGLSISYFLRATKFYDTLLQMGRWFGYRPGYADLCRVFTTEELVRWYQYIGNATEELKDQFDIMEFAERNPKNFGLKVRSAPGMLMISSAVKIRGATDLNLSFSGGLLETYLLSKHSDILHNNLKAVNNLVANLGTSSGKIRQKQRYIWENISYKIVDRFLDNYRTEQHNIRTDFLLGYINKQVNHQHLINWTVVIISNTVDGKRYKIETGNQVLEMGLTLREQEGEEKNGISNIDQENYIIRQSRIISPPHEYLDMDETDPRYIKAQEDSKVKNKKPAGKFIRKHRGAQNALLLVYLLDPKGFGGIEELPAVGYAISLPKIENDILYPYKVNDAFLREYFDYPTSVEENPENE